MGRGASWYPLYDLQACSQDGKPSAFVSLHYRVNLSQRTGEDWNDARLILSTSETNVLNAGIPESDGLVIEPKPKPPPPRSLERKKDLLVKLKRAHTALSVMERGSEPSSESEFGLHDDVDYSRELLGAAAVLSEMSEGGAVISKSPMAVSYTVDELTTIPSNGQSHKVLVAVIPLEASISHTTTPRKSPLAYLQVRFSAPPICHLANYATISSALSRIRASILCFLEPSASSSTIRLSPKRRYLRLPPETHSTAHSGWTHLSKFPIPSRKHLRPQLRLPS